MNRIGPAIVVVALLVAGCSSDKVKPTNSPSQSSGTPRPSATHVADAGLVCEALKTQGLLMSADGFVLAANVLKPGDVQSTVVALQVVEAEAPVEFQTPLTNIIDTLTAIDAAVRAGDGRTVDTSTVQPDARLLAGMCRSRGLPIPETV